MGAAYWLVAPHGLFVLFFLFLLLLVVVVVYTHTHVHIHASTHTHTRAYACARATHTYIPQDHHPRDGITHFLNLVSLLSDRLCQVDIKLASTPPEGKPPAAEEEGGT